MKSKSPYAAGMTLFLSLSIATPADLWAGPQAAGQRAGEVSRVIPAVSIARGTRNITASPKSAVDWQDLVNTQVNGRARIALDDGSVLNVGSESSMRVVKHDAGAQQTDLELSYGKLRTQAQKIARPGGKFEVRTPAGVAGVVGTDFYVAFANGIMNVIVFEGLVRVCNLAGVCVEVKAGQMSSVQTGDNSAPLPPSQAALDLLVEASNNTGIEGPAGKGVQEAGQHAGHGTVAGLIFLAAIPAIVFPILATRESKSLPPVPVQPPVVAGCKPSPNAPCP